MVLGFDPLINPLLDKRYETLLGRRITGIDDVTQGAVMDLVGEGLRRGYSPLQIANGVPDEEFAGVNSIFEDTYRDEMIARTETMFAYNWAAGNAFVDSGIQQVEAMDGSDDPECAARNGEIYDLDPDTGRPVDDSGEVVEDHPNGTLAWAPVVSADSPPIDTGAIEELGLDHWEFKYSEDQSRDDHGRFGEGGAWHGSLGSRIAVGDKVQTFKDQDHAGAAIAMLHNFGDFTYSLAGNAFIKPGADATVVEGHSQSFQLAPTRLELNAFLDTNARLLAQNDHAVAGFRDSNGTARLDIIKLGNKGALVIEMKYAEGQARDYHGRFGGGAPPPAAAPKVPSNFNKPAGSSLPSWMHPQGMGQEPVPQTGDAGHAPGQIFDPTSVSKVSADQEGGHVNKMYVVTFNDGRSGCFKPDSQGAHDMNYHPEYPGAALEAGAYVIDKACGINLVPPTEVFAGTETSGPGARLTPMGQGSMQQWTGALPDAPSDPTYGRSRDVSYYTKDSVERMAVLDYITGNTDRHGNNFLTNTVTKEPIAIDNGLTFGKGYGSNNDRGGFLQATSQVSDATIGRLQGVDQVKLAADLLATGVPDVQVGKAMGRLNDIINSSGGKAPWMSTDRYGDVNVGQADMGSTPAVAPANEQWSPGNGAVPNGPQGGGMGAETAARIFAQGTPASYDTNVAQAARIAENPPSAKFDPAGSNILDRPSAGVTRGRNTALQIKNNLNLSNTPMYRDARGKLRGLS
jgi:hypothetical protein